MENHIIELSERYQLKATDECLVLYQLKLQDNTLRLRVAKYASKQVVISLTAVLIIGKHKSKQILII